MLVEDADTFDANVVLALFEKITAMLPTSGYELD
jgi:hypothetical protein